MRGEYGEIQPVPRLARYVECYWWRNAARGATDQYVLPDGCTDIVFGKRGGEPVSLDAVGLMTRPRVFAAPIGQSWFGVRFRPGMGSAFLPGAGELKDRVEPLEAILGGGARRVFERLSEKTNPTDMAAWFDRILRPALPADHGDRALWLLGRPEAAGGDVRQSGISPRHLRRICLERAGVSPKFLERILRFRAATDRLAALRAPGRVNWAELAIGWGYFDQAHMVREFHTFAGLTPGRFLQSRRRAESLDSDHHGETGKSD